MERDDLELLRGLLTECRVLALALVDGAVPVAGLMPFLAHADLGSLYVHGSRLAKHTRALAAGAPSRRSSTGRTSPSTTRCSSPV